MDPAGYEPRRLKGMALSYALSPRGACHLRATFYKPELGGLLEDLDDDTYVETYIDWEDRMLLWTASPCAASIAICSRWDFLTSADDPVERGAGGKAELEELSTTRHSPASAASIWPSALTPAGRHGR